MRVILVSYVTIFLYAIAAGTQWAGLLGRIRQPMCWVFGFGIVAVSLHALLLHIWIDVASGQNLNILNMLSLTLWLIAILLLAVMSFRSIGVMVMVIFPLAILSILMVLFFPAQYIVQTAANTHALFHIVLAIFTVCVLCFAGFLAVFLAIQERLLHTKRMDVLMQKLPPLVLMEGLLFQVITLGFILLSIVLVTSFYFYHDLLQTQLVLLQKTILVVAAWLVFAVLLLGRQYSGWRGQRAIYYTLFGVGLLLVAYFGSKVSVQHLF